MKFLSLFRRYLLVELAVLLLAGCVAHFFIFRFFIHRSTDKILEEQQLRIERYAALNDTLIPVSESVLQPPQMEVRAAISALPRYYRDTVLYSESSGAFIPYRQLLFTVHYKGAWQLVTLNQPSMEARDLFLPILSSLGLLFLLFLLFAWLTGRLFSRRLWPPFFKTLTSLQQYDMRQDSHVDTDLSGIEEFDALNRVVRQMTDRIREDYLNLKNFTEDVSHEMQTPLSVIKSHLDVLIQEPAGHALTEHTGAMLHAVNRLSRLVRSLLLLAKINNNQYPEQTAADLTGLLAQGIDDLAEVMASKVFSLQFDREADRFVVQMNRELAEVLISNLLTNAIRYTPPHGRIMVCSSLERLSISNTCTASQLPRDIFGRFQKDENNRDATGLGLHIVKSICDQSGLQIAYALEDGMFRICLERV